MKKKIIFTILILLTSYQVGITQINKTDSPTKNFEKLWKEFDKRYANFELKKINWDEIYEKYKSLIDEKTINKKLFEVCCLMLQELNDGHVTIEPHFQEDDIECGAPYDFSLELAFDSEDSFLEFESILDDELKKNGFSEPIRKKLSENTNFQYRVSDSFAYLRLDEMTEKFTLGKFKKAVDESIQAFQQKKGLIIDLRFNGGGWDYSAYKLASRFVPKEQYIGHFERTRIKGETGFTPMKYKKVQSGGKNQFVNPIVILTSDFTASAAEVFILLMNELPNVTIIGDHTEGIFSDMYQFRLPNKWDVTLSHQQYFSQDGKNFEGIGIPPDIQVVNSRTDIEHQHDPVIQTAILHLQKENKH